MLLLAHPTGNNFVRALLSSLEATGELNSFYTTVAVQPSSWYVRCSPSAISKELLRRTYSIPKSKVRTRPFRELTRLAASKLGMNRLITHETGWACIDSVYQDLDHYLSRKLREPTTNQQIFGVYCYEDAAFQTFQTAKQLGLTCFYDLPIAYWKTIQKLLSEEAERLPEWEPTLVGTRNSCQKLERKTRELEMADVVICPSKFVYDSLPELAQSNKQCIIAEFGSPVLDIQTQPVRASKTSPLRVLFAGSMTQRKGLADVFAAIKLLKRVDVELVVMGSPVAPLEFYRQQLSNFTYEPTRPHHAVLQLMQTCDLLVLPSIAEGRALVQQEAMSCGLPLIVTANAGGEDLIDEGKTGFLVPIRSPEQIAEKISWFADHRQQLEEMRELAQQKSAQVTWHTYCQKILNVVQSSRNR